jgi:hypothetical protein
LNSSADATSHQRQSVSATHDAASVSHKRKRLRKPDTNVLSIKFNRLLQPGKNFFFFDILHNFIYQVKCMLVILSVVQIVVQ